MPMRGLDLRECRVTPLNAETREPPERGTLEPLRLGLAHDRAERVTQIDVRNSPATLRMIAMLPAFDARRRRAYADP